MFIYISLPLTRPNMNMFTLSRLMLSRYKFRSLCICGTWLVHRCEMAFACLHCRVALCRGNGSGVCLCVWHMTHSHVCVCVCVIQVQESVCVCKMMHSQHDCATWLIDICDWFICVTWLVHRCDMAFACWHWRGSCCRSTGSGVNVCMWHDSFACVCAIQVQGILHFALRMFKEGLPLYRSEACVRYRLPFALRMSKRGLPLYRSEACVQYRFHFALRISKRRLPLYRSEACVRYRFHFALRISKESLPLDMSKEVFVIPDFVHSGHRQFHCKGSKELALLKGIHEGGPLCVQTCTLGRAYLGRALMASLGPSRGTEWRRWEDSWVFATRSLCIVANLSPCESSATWRLKRHIKETYKETVKRDKYVSFMNLRRRLTGTPFTLNRGAASWYSCSLWISLCQTLSPLPPAHSHTCTLSSLQSLSGMSSSLLLSLSVTQAEVRQCCALPKPLPVWQKARARENLTSQKERYVWQCKVNRCMDHKAQVQGGENS